MKEQIENLQDALEAFDKDIADKVRVSNTRTAAAKLVQSLDCKEPAEVKIELLVDFENKLKEWLMKKGVSKKTLNNTIHYLKFIKRWLIRKSILPLEERRTMPEWLLLERVVKTFQRDRGCIHVFTKFADWCSEQNIKPQEINADIVLSYGKQLKEMDMAYGSEKYTKLKRMLKFLMEKGALQKFSMLTLCEIRQPYAIRYKDWPQGLKDEYEKYIKWVSRTVVLGRPFKYNQRQTTIAGNLLLLELYVGWIRNICGEKIDNFTLSDLFTRERIERYFDWLDVKHNKETTTTHVHALSLFRVICREYLGNYLNIQIPATALLESADINITHKENLKENSATMEELYGMTQKIYEKYQNAHSARRKAVRFRDYIIVSLLIERPLRSRNMIECRLGRNLFKKDGEWFLSFQGLDVKAENVNKPFPKKLIPDLELYLDTYRPLLAKRKSDYLFLTEHGNKIPYDLFYAIITNHTRRYLQKTINPHAFRDIVALDALKLPSMDNDSKLLIIQDLLDHKDIKSTMKYLKKLDKRNLIYKYDEAKATRLSGQSAKEMELKRENDDLKKANEEQGQLIEALMKANAERSKGAK